MNSLLTGFLLLLGMSWKLLTLELFCLPGVFFDCVEATLVVTVILHSCCKAGHTVSI